MLFIVSQNWSDSTTRLQ